MGRRAIGVDVGTNAVRAVEVAGGDRPEVRRFGQVALPAGAVREGEVVDVDAVGGALRRLWKEAGFSSRTVRVGLASARVILRVVEVPRLSDADTTSALSLQLDDYVPIRAEDTVFDFQPLPDAAPGERDGATRRVVLAAAHQEAVRPLVEAVRAAGLKIGAVDVVPAALARSIDTGEIPDGEVDVIVSIGGGTIVVVAARDGAPVFARTITNISGRHITERIAARLAVSEVEAERFKRGDLDDPERSSAARLAAAPAVAELVQEIRDSLDFYVGQPGALHVRRLLLTGGASLLEDLDLELERGVGLRTEFADPFVGTTGVPDGFDASDLPYLAPYIPTALGLALVTDRRHAKTLSLLPAAVRVERNRRRPVLVAGGAVLVLATGALYVQRRGEVADQRAATAAAEQALVTEQAALAESATGGRVDPIDALGIAIAVSEAAAARDLDWLTVRQHLDALTASVGADILGFQAVVDQPAVVEEPEPDPATATEPASGSEEPAAGEVGVDAAAEPTPVPVGRASLAGRAPDVDAVAAWLDAVATDARFTGTWISDITTVELADGTSHVQFTAEVVVTSDALAAPIISEEPTP